MTRFDILRGKLSGQVGEKRESQKEAMARRMAAMGGAGSGEAIKEDIEGEKALNLEEMAGRGAVSAAEAEDIGAKMEAERGREYGAGEAKSQRGFRRAAQQEQQKFASKEAAGQRAQAGRMMFGEIDTNRKLSANQRKYDMGMAKMNETFARQQLDWQKTVDQFNMDMAEMMANKKDIFERAGDWYNQNPTTQKYWQGQRGGAGGSGRWDWQPGTSGVPSGGGMSSGNIPRY